MQTLVRKNEYDIIDNVEIGGLLPIGNYELSLGAFGRIYFKKVEDIVIPEKVYSNDADFIAHVMKSWKDGEGSVGVALAGGKGLGKSFTGNQIAVQANVPVIRIIGGLPKSNAIFSVLNTIDQDFVLFIDEFEKSFNVGKDNQNPDAMSQQDFLTFLDNGSVRKNKILFIVTSNSISNINEFLKNRPSRLKYFKEYEKLSNKIIKEIVNDLLVYPEHRDDLLEKLSTSELNMDVLIQIIKEINTHNKPYSSFKEFFNFRTKAYELFDIGTVIDGVPYVIKQYASGNYYDDDAIGRHPTKEHLRIYSKGYFNLAEGVGRVNKGWYSEAKDKDGNDIEIEINLTVVKSEFRNLAKVF
jgi:hypothetical protein